ncbi:hypothetical protein, partial [Selenomonas sp.]|uniref:hypothetical protein n=1 Tax=Selenomonas sp. TaxID=2053611 RepID=UPI0025CE6602
RGATGTETERTREPETQSCVLRFSFCRDARKVNEFNKKTEKILAISRSLRYNKQRKENVFKEEFPEGM